MDFSYSFYIVVKFFFIHSFQCEIRYYFFRFYQSYLIFVSYFQISFRVIYINFAVLYGDFHTFRITVNPHFIKIYHCIGKYLVVCGYFFKYLFYHFKISVMRMMIYDYRNIAAFQIVNHGKIISDHLFFCIVRANQSANTYGMNRYLQCRRKITRNIRIRRKVIIIKAKFRGIKEIFFDNFLQSDIPLAKRCGKAI